MLTVRLTAEPGDACVLAVPVFAGTDEKDDPAATGNPHGPRHSGAGLPPAGTGLPLAEDLTAEIRAFLADRDHTGRAGLVHALPRPLRVPARVLLVGVGGGTEADWRAAGAALARSAAREDRVAVGLPAGCRPDAVRGLAEGALLAGYRFRLGADHNPPRLRELALVSGAPDGLDDALRAARTVAAATTLARDLVNTPSQTKTPRWLAARIVEAAAGRPGLTVSVRDPGALAAEGFGGILAVGGGSTRGPRLLEVSWSPPGAGRHVVLVGKGITFDTGGIVVKRRDAMKLMRKDMAGAAAVTAATLGAADLKLPVRVTALAPLAENMLSGTAYRPGDVVRHYGGITTEIHNTDAEGRVVLGDALAYAARLAPDFLVDLATLTGAGVVALGKRTAALYTHNEALARALRAAADAAGEQVWRMPLPEDYRHALDSEIADLTNAPNIGAGSVTAALFLREFTGAARPRWAHLDMSAPAWSDTNDGELVKGATGWGVRLLVRWLASLA